MTTPFTDLIAAVNNTPLHETETTSEHFEDWGPDKTVVFNLADDVVESMAASLNAMTADELRVAIPRLVAEIDKKRLHVLNAKLAALPAFKEAMAKLAGAPEER